MLKIKITINHQSGLHARPAAKFVQTATAFPCVINVRNLDTDTKPVNAKSILSVLTLGVNQGGTIEVEADGPKEEEALNSLKALIENNFEEKAL